MILCSQGGGGQGAERLGRSSIVGIAKLCVKRSHSRRYERCEAHLCEHENSLF